MKRKPGDPEVPEWHKHRARRVPKAGVKKKAVSNYEGFRRIDVAKEKLEKKDRSREVCCEVCGRRTKAWRGVPSTDGRRALQTPAARKGALRAPVLIACDNGPDSCAQMLLRHGVDKRAIEVEKKLGELGIVVTS